MRTNTVVDPRTMVIVSTDTSFANVTVKHFIIRLSFALCTEIPLYLHQRLASSFALFSQK